MFCRRPLIKSAYQKKLFFLFLNQNICYRWVKEIHRNFVYLNPCLSGQQLRWCRPLETLFTVCTCMYPKGRGTGSLDPPGKSQVVIRFLGNTGVNIPREVMRSIEGGLYSHLWNMLMNKTFEDPPPPFHRIFWIYACSSLTAVADIGAINLRILSSFYFMTFSSIFSLMSKMCRALMKPKVHVGLGKTKHSLSLLRRNSS